MAERLTILLEPLTDRDLSYLVRIVDEHNGRAELTSNKQQRAAYIDTPFIDVAQTIACRLITTAISFTYIPNSQ